MNELIVKKVNTLPGTYTASTMYLVKSATADLFDIYMSSEDGLSVRHIISEPDIQTKINTALAAASEVKVVANIAARNALAPTSNIYVMVLDATGDATVSTGAATYIYNTANTTWYKVTEYESLDFSFTWDSISGKPTSTAGDIDSAVTLKHSHANKSLLDKISEDGDGDMLYNGSPLPIHLATAEW